MNLSRRDFITFTSGLALSAAGCGVLWKKFLTSASNDKEESIFFVTAEGKLTCANVGTGNFLQLQTELKRPHGYVHINNEHPKILVIEKWGDKALVLDVKSRQIERYVQSSPGMDFYGHGCYLNKQKAWLAVEAGSPMGETGSIVIRDSVDHKIIGRIPSYG